MESKSVTVDIFFLIEREEEEIIVQLIEQNFNLIPVVIDNIQENKMFVHIYTDQKSQDEIVNQLIVLQQEMIVLEILSPKKWDIQIHISHDKDWQNHWKEYFYPIMIENKIQVTPAWETPNPELPNLMLEPKMGFGTGQHATTYLCLELLSHQELSGKNLIDIGAGSGILGAAGLILGAKHSLFIEIDPQAVESCYDTIERNQLQNSSQVLSVDIFNMSYQTLNKKIDIALINIVAGVISKIITLNFIKSIPVLILSGILEEKLDEVTSIIKEQNYFIADMKKKDEWVALLVYTSTVT